MSVASAFFVRLQFSFRATKMKRPRPRGGKRGKYGLVLALSVTYQFMA